MPCNCRPIVLAVVFAATGETEAVAQRAGPPHGDTIVRVAGAPRHPGVATLREEVSIGVPVGAPEYMFGDVADIAVAPDRSVVILDRKGQFVRRYDANGKFVMNLGGRGQGPGEHLTVSGVSFLPDGRILVWDTRNWRVNVFSPTGVYQTLWPIVVNTSQSSAGARGLVVDTAGISYVRRFVFDRQALWVVNFWVRLDRNGKTLDTLPEPTVAGSEIGLPAIAPGGRSRSTMDVPFSPVAMRVLSPHGHFVTGYPGRHAFEIVRPGQPIISVRRPDARSTPVSAHERDSARASVIERQRRVDPTWTWNGPDIPKTKPFYSRITVGADGRIWLALIPETLPKFGSISNSTMGGSGPAGRLPPPPVSTARELSDAKRPALYDVFEANGTYLGQVEIPPRQVLATANGDFVWTLAYDDDDVSSVKRHRIAWP